MQRHHLGRQLLAAFDGSQDLGVIVQEGNVKTSATASLLGTLQPAHVHQGPVPQDSFLPCSFLCSPEAFGILWIDRHIEIPTPRVVQVVQEHHLAEAHGIATYALPATNGAIMRQHDRHGHLR
jgi:hypothetical protein